MNLSILLNASPVIGPSVSSDLIISKNGDKYVVESTSFKSKRI